jgi:hypothetical protein
MKLHSGILLGLIVLIAGSAVEAQYHEPVYIAGGYNAISTVNERGVFKIDAGAGSMATLFLPRYHTLGFKMDVDNRKIVFATGYQFSSNTLYSGPHAGIYRFDPATQQFTTVRYDTMTFYRPYKLHVNQDGDYVVGSYTRNWTGSRTEYHYRVVKVDRAGTLTTLLTSAKLGRSAAFYSSIGTNIDTGHYLVCDHTSITSPSTIRYPVLELTDDGTVQSWSTGGRYGWYGYYSAPQDFRTGELTGPYGTRIYRLTPGFDTRTTIGTLSLVSGTSLTQSRYDVQSAARPRWIAVGYRTSAPYQTYIYNIDALTGLVTSVLVDPAHRSVFYDFAFYRGRHVQTVKVAPRRWEVRLSLPEHAGKLYTMALTLSGIRPGLSLPDGRTFFLNPDVFTILTLQNLIPGIFDPGPGRLDASGEARGVLDASTIPKLGYPFWIAVAVLDPKAPLGIAFLPDVRVVRI